MATPESFQRASDEDDMEYELASDISTLLSPPADESDDNDEGGMSVYFDADNGDEAETETSNDLTEAHEDEDRGSRASQATEREHTRTITLTPHQILQLLSQAGLRGYFARPATRRSAVSQQHGGAEEEEDDEDDDDEDTADDAYYDEYYGNFNRRRKRRNFVGDRYPKFPSEAGAAQMHSGNFGITERRAYTARGVALDAETLRRRKTLARRMLDRELGVSAPGFSHHARTLTQLTTQGLIPSSEPDLIINMDDRCYSGQFSDDGSFFFACGKDFKVRMYDTSNPYDWKYYKTVNYYEGQWTLTDASLSPDNQLLAYSSIRALVCLATTDRRDTSDPRPLDISDMGRNDYAHGRSHFGIWSLRFSGDGSELICGTSDHCVYVYDLNVGRSTLRIPGHSDHVNAVCYGDKLSPHILYSGSDDTTLKVWDRRSLASMRPAGMFLGHTEGLTYVDSKGDGRYVISNGKDQTCKLWDLRKMVSTEEGEKIDPQMFTTNFDYRYQPYDKEDHVPHPRDCSVVTFHGHRVLKTLIRCHFSPAENTNGRYIYSGSHDGKVWIWNLDGTTAGQIDVNTATKNARPGLNVNRMDPYNSEGHGSRARTIVRDCSWHPQAPVIAATSWNGWNDDLGACTVHSWDDGVAADEVGPDDMSRRGEMHAKASCLGEAPRGARVTAQLKYEPHYYSNASRRSTRRWAPTGLGGIFATGDDDDDD